MATKTTHVHKYRRLTYKSGNQIFFCALPDCNQKINIALALGKRSLCWRCGEPFVMTEYSLRLAKPHCTDCHKPKFSNSSEILNFNNSPGEQKTLSLADRLKQTIETVRDRGNDEEEI